MSRTKLEDQVAAVLRHQADSIEPSRLDATDLVDRRTLTDGTSHSEPSVMRRRPLLAAAAAVLVVAGLAVIGARLTSAPTPVATAEPSPPGPVPNSADVPPPGAKPAFRFGNPLVQFAADEVWVEQDGEVFRPVTGVEQGDGGIWRDWTGAYDPGVQGDPLDPRSTTELDLIWFEHGHEMRINLQFESDGTDWWASEVSTYDPLAEPEPDWVRQEGEFFRSPVDTPFEGNVDLGPLHLRGLKLLALPTPEQCQQSTSPIALLHDAGFSAPAAQGSEAFVTIIDTASCEPVDAAPYDFTVSSDNNAVTAASVLPPDQDAATGQRRLSFEVSGTNPVSLLVTAVDRQSGKTVAEVDLAINQQDVTADPPQQREPETDDAVPEG